VHGGLRSPAHDEEASGEEERPNYHGHQAGFGHELIAVGDEALLVEDLTPEINGCCE